MAFDQATEKRLFELTSVFIHSGTAEFDLKRTMELKDVLRYHEWKYYVQNNPVISDFEYDQLYQLLVDIEAQHPEWVTADSPTQRVGNDLTSDFPTVRHWVPMLSLDNSYNAEDLKDFDRQVRKLCGLNEMAIVEYVVEPKFDGGSIALNYENDYFTRAATRGNGEEGDEITNNARTIHSLPLSVKFRDLGVQKVELRGEVVLHKDDFIQINRDREKSGLPIFANPRNAATGGLRMKDPKEVADRQLAVFVFQMGYAVDAQGNDHLKDLKTHFKTMHTLSSLGFKVAMDVMKCFDNIKDVADYCLQWEALRDQYPYEMDGMVVKVNRFDL